MRFFYNTIKTQIAAKDFTDIVRRAFNEFVNEMNKQDLNESDEQQDNELDKEPNWNDKQNDKEPDENSGKPAKLKFTNIRVTMPDGSVIYHDNGKQTYLDALEKLGLEEVMRVRPNIVATEQFSLVTKGVKCGRFWVRGTNGFSTKDRIAELKKITGLLGISLLIEQVEKKPKS